MSEPAVEDRMGAFDAVMWGVETDPVLRSVIIAMIVLDRDPDMEVARDRADRMSRAIPKLRQRIVGNPASVVPPRWETDPNFDLDYHVQHVRVVDDGTMRPAIGVAERMAAQDFDRHRPAWEVMVIGGLPDGKAAAVVKIHHAITDGVGGMMMAAYLFDLTREPRTDLGDLPDAPEENILDPLGRLRSGLEYEGRNLKERAKEVGVGATHLAQKAVSSPVDFAKDSGAFAASTGRMLAPAGVPMSSLMVGRSLSVHFDFLELPLADLKRAAKAAGGTLNDAYMAGVTGALWRYHHRHDVEVTELRVNMPVNLRKPGDAQVGGNAWVPARFPVPVSSAPAAERIKQLHPVLLQARTEPALVLTSPVMRLLARLPMPVTTQISGGMMKGTDFAATNVPGPPIPIYMGGAEIESILVFAPKGGSSANFGLMTYNQKAIIGVNMDTRPIPDPDVFMECVRESFAEVCAVGA